MTKFRPSRPFVLALLGLCLLLMGPVYVFSRTSQSTSSSREESFHRIQKRTILDTILLKFKDSKARRGGAAKAKFCEAWFQRILARHPDMAVPSKNVPDDQNGFLEWLNFADGYQKPGTSVSKLQFPKELNDFLLQQGEWNPEMARAWLTEQKPLLDKIRTIGLMPDQSNHGINIKRYGFLEASLPKSCADALLIEARLAAADGNAASAMESIRAAHGLADHFDQIETPSLLNATVSIVIRQGLSKFVLTEVMPNLPAGTIDAAAWEDVLKPTVSPPAEFGRILKGEWNVGLQYLILPALADTQDPGNPPDPEELMDAYTENYRRRINAYASLDLENLRSISVADSSENLSEKSREFLEILESGSQAWQKGWLRVQSVSGMTQAAFAIMKGQPIPNDPIFGLPYDWDPATRTLSAPSSPAFDEMKLNPIIVPKL